MLLEDLRLLDVYKAYLFRVFENGSQHRDYVCFRREPFGNVQKALQLLQGDCDGCTGHEAHNCWVCKKVDDEPKSARVQSDIVSAIITLFLSQEDWTNQSLFMRKLFTLWTSGSQELRMFTLRCPKPPESLQQRRWQ